MSRLIDEWTQLLYPQGDDGYSLTYENRPPKYEIAYFRDGRDAAYAYLISAAIAETAIKYANPELQHTLHRLLCVARSFEFEECSKAEWVAAKNQAYKLYQAAPNPSPHRHACWAVYEALSGRPATIIPLTSEAAGDAASFAEQAKWGNPRDAIKWGEAARYLLYEDHWDIVEVYQPILIGIK